MPLQRKREGLNDGERVVIVWRSCTRGDTGHSQTCMPRANAEAWRREVAPQYPDLALWIELCSEDTTSDSMCGKNGRILLVNHKVRQLCLAYAFFEGS